MKLTSIKSAKDAGVPGIEFVYTDKAITEVVIGKLRIRKGESYSSSLQVLIESPFEEVDRYRLVGKIDGFPDAVSYFDDEYTAKSEGAKLEDKGASFTVTKVKVAIDEDGAVVDAKPAELIKQDADALEVPF